MIDEAHLRVGVQHRVIRIDGLGSGERALSATTSSSSCSAALLLLLRLLSLLGPDLVLSILRLRAHSLVLPRAISRPLVIVGTGLLLIELVLRGVGGVQLMRRRVRVGVGDGVLVGVVEHRVGFLRVVFLFCTESI